MNTEYKKGIFLALSAYILWGILPIYWQFVDEIGAFEILAFRIIFSAIFMIFHTRGWTKTTQCISTRYESIVRQAHSAISDCRSRLCHYIKLGYIYLGCNERSRPTNKFRLLYKSTC